MNVLTHVKESFVNLAASKLRSFLAILGILVGTASVVTLVSSSLMATNNALKQFKSLGTNLLSVNIMQEQSSTHTKQVRHLRLKDMAALVRGAPQVNLVAPYTNVYASVYYNGHALNAQSVGATESLPKVVKLHIDKGRFVSRLDKDAPFCVIGAKLVKDLKKYGVFNQIGKQLQVGHTIFTVIGTTKPWQTNLFMSADLNSSVIIPLQASFLLSKYAEINNLMFRLKKNPNLKLAQQHVSAALQKIIPGRKFTFRSPQQIIGIMSKQRSTFTWLLGTIGGISLIVGGIGVMNIMLVSVVERRREIGIRMAIGANSSDIRWMFLIEAVTLTIFGGILGVLVGILVSVVVAIFAKWQITFFLLPPFLGFIVSVIVGVLSGFYPAFRASKLDPIDALQTD